LIPGDIRVYSSGMRISSSLEGRATPDRRTCLLILKRECVPVHILEHSMRVAQVTVCLGFFLKKAGIGIDLPLAEAGALLHDVSKMRSIEAREDHAEGGAKLLLALGLDDVAGIVRQHVHLSPEWDPVRGISEAVLVNYADKRVRHTEIVTLSDRFEDLACRYGTTPERRARIEAMCEVTRDIEKNIFVRLRIAPEKINLLNRLKPDKTCDDMMFQEEMEVICQPG